MFVMDEMSSRRFRLPLFHFVSGAVRDMHPHTLIAAVEISFMPTFFRALNYQGKHIFTQFNVNYAVYYGSVDSH